MDEARGLQEVFDDALHGAHLRDALASWSFRKTLKVRKESSQVDAMAIPAKIVRHPEI